MVISNRIVSNYKLVTLTDSNNINHWFTNQETLEEYICFLEMRNILMKILDSEFHNLTTTEAEKMEILIVKEILHKYTFVNRLQQKGRLSRIITYSLNLSY